MTDFPLQHPPLRSLSEAAGDYCGRCGALQTEANVEADSCTQCNYAVNICEHPDCDDEIPEDQQLCNTHRREQARCYQEALWAADGEDELVWYPTLTDEEEHLR